MVVGRRDELVGASCRVQISNVVTRFVTSAELWPCRRAHARARETRETVRWPPLLPLPLARRCCLELLFGFLRVKYGVFGTYAGRVGRFDLAHFLPNSECTLLSSGKGDCSRLMRAVGSTCTRKMAKHSNATKYSQVTTYMRPLPGRKAVSSECSWRTRLLRDPRWTVDTLRLSSRLSRIRPRFYTCV
ncbi:uncharacterized protein LOC116847137 [Odontomachus brunneus]|uniref:uncharacterized protein LOC116847137 n=1 Tax=Odontomachus brunneus TaxID=486640 RepID=UPI0013F26001|nr:uncharacterized protein LOC116847137 [Odontomachus brunneus]